jgi:choline dehydrogenase-like flavoprotein
VFFNFSDVIMQVREQATNAWHFVGSCGIGRVLDSDLRVIGFDNLKVVDASAIPDMPENSGPAGTTYMLAEYAAERIIAEASDIFGDDVAGVDDDKENSKGQTG